MWVQPSANTPRPGGERGAEPTLGCAHGLTPSHPASCGRHTAAPRGNADGSHQNPVT